MAETATSGDIMAADNREQRDQVIELLKKAYWMEIETVMSYIANSVNPDGVRAQEIKESLEQDALQPPEHQTDVVHVIKGVIEAETGAIEHYNAIIEATDQADPVTNDMVIAILRDEEGHRRLFEGYLREYEIEGKA